MRNRGTSLLELLVTLGLAGVVARIATPQLSALRVHARLAGASRTVATQLRLARGVAIAQGLAVTVRFDAPRRVCEVIDRDGRWLATGALPPGIAFGALPARRRILFGALGTAENGTVTLAAGARTRRVIVNQRGRVRLS